MVKETAASEGWDGDETASLHMQMKWHHNIFLATNGTILTNFIARGKGNAGLR